MEPETSFAARRFSVAFNAGLPTGAGVRAGVSIIPEVGVEAHAGTALLFQDYGVDLVVRPLASRYNVTPTVRVGMGVMQNNLAAALGGREWLPLPSAAAGVEWRANNGFLLGGDVGISVPITPGDGATLPTTAQVAPNFNLTIGYSW